MALVLVSCLKFSTAIWVTPERIGCLARGAIDSSCVHRFDFWMKVGEVAGSSERVVQRTSYNYNVSLCPHRAFGKSTGN